MYSPAQDGFEKSHRSMHYEEAKPSGDLQHLSRLVHCFWELKTTSVLTEDFHFHALPDACVNVLLNQAEPEIAGITALRTKYEVLNLSKSFHYVGIQFFPGVWNGNKDEIVDHYVGTPYAGSLPLIETNHRLTGTDFIEKQRVLAELVEWFIDEGVVVANPVVEKILAALDEIRSVADMAAINDLSPRQLQRILKQTTGLSPHDLLKVLRMQQSFKKHYLDLYADQSHFIHSFRKITGYTPAKYFEKFDV
jgi:AraC-like DNA-binding protein